MTHLAFLGTGLLGSALVEAALKRGDHVTVWNRTAAKARALEQFGALVADTPADAVRGVERKFLHCPVFIGPPAARESQGTILVCGPRALFDAVRSDFSKMAGRVEYFGERPDVAAVFKLCGNAFIVGINALVADVFAVASASRVASADALKVVELFNPAAVITARGKKMVSGDFTPTFELAMARKDVRLMLETAGDLPLAALPLIAERMDALLEQGHAKDDLAVIGTDSVRRQASEVS